MTKLSYNDSHKGYTLLSLLFHFILLAIILDSLSSFFLVVHQPRRYLTIPAHAVLSDFFKPDKNLV